MDIAFDFNSKRILITGASSGIGQKLAWELSLANANLILLGRDEVKLALTKSGLKSGDSAKIFAGDLIMADFIEKLVVEIEPLDGLVLAAGIIDYTPTKMINKQRIERVFDINFSANVLLIQKLLKNKKIKPGASIVIISSISSKLAVAGTALYAASKAAIISYAKVLATELASKNIRVNSILPGIVKTDLIDSKGILEQGQLSDIEKFYPLGFGTTLDVSNQIMYLLSGASKWVTGAEIIIDGGHTLR